MTNHRYRIKESTLKIFYDINHQLHAIKNSENDELKPLVDNFYKALREKKPLYQTFDVLMKNEKFKGKINNSLDQKYNQGMFTSVQVALGLKKKTELYYDADKTRTQLSLYQPAFIDFFKQNEDRNTAEIQIYNGMVAPADVTMSHKAQALYNRIKWDYWYWPNIYYGKGSWKVYPYIISKIFSDVLFMFIGPLMAPPMLLQLTLGVVAMFFGLGVVSLPKDETPWYEKFALICFGAALIVGLSFCPPLSIGLIFGANLPVAAMIFAQMGFVLLVNLGFKTIGSFIKSLIEHRQFDNFDGVVEPSDEDRSLLPFGAFQR